MSIWKRRDWRLLPNGKTKLVKSETTGADKDGWYSTRDWTHFDRLPFHFWTNGSGDFFIGGDDTGFVYFFYLEDRNQFLIEFRRFD